MVNIRRMAAGDLQRVQEVARLGWKSTYAGIIPEHIQENFLNVAYSDASLKSRLERSLMIVSEEKGQINGFANFSWVKENKSDLFAIYLKPSVQGRGIGTALLQRGVVELEGLGELYVNVEKDNTIGRTFYEAKGFQTVGEFDDNFDGHILKTVRMVLHVHE